MIVQSTIISLPFDPAMKMNGLISETVMANPAGKRLWRREAFNRRYTTEATISHLFPALKGRATGGCRYATQRSASHSDGAICAVAIRTLLKSPARHSFGHFREVLQRQIEEAGQRAAAGGLL
jgi:hypothetical protein